MTRTVNLRDVKSKTDHSMPKSFRLRNKNVKKKTNIPKSKLINALKSPWAKATTPEPCRPLKRDKSPHILLGEWMKSRGISTKHNLHNKDNDSETMVDSCMKYIGKEIKDTRESLQLLEEISTIMPSIRKYRSFWMSKAKITELQDGKLTPIFKEAIKNIDSESICDKENETPSKEKMNKSYHLSNLTPQFKKLKTGNESMVSVLTPVRRSLRFQCQNKCKQSKMNSQICKDENKVVAKDSNSHDEKSDIDTATLQKPHRMIVEDLSRIKSPERVMFRENQAIID